MIKQPSRLSFDMANGVEPDQAAELLSKIGQSTLESERTQYQRLETRAAAIVTTTGGLVTVIGAVTAFVPEDQRSRAFSTPSLVLVIIALILFLSAVLLAQVANLTGTGISYMRKDFDKIELHAGEPAGPLLRESAHDNLRLAQDYRNACQERVNFVALATVSQMLAVAVLTAAVITAVLRLT